MKMLALMLSLACAHGMASVHDSDHVTQCTYSIQNTFKDIRSIGVFELRLPQSALNAIRSDLESKGYVEAPTGSNANVVVDFTYVQDWDGGDKKNCYYFYKVTADLFINGVRDHFSRELVIPRRLFQSCDVDSKRFQREREEFLNRLPVVFSDVVRDCK